jgi:hypothetical protein
LRAIAAIVAASIAASAAAAQNPDDSNPIRLFEAFKAAYGQPAPVDVSVNQPDAGGAVKLRLSPGALVPVTPQITLLITKAEAGEQCGRFCEGTLLFHYLSRTPRGYQTLGNWKDLAGGGQFGAAPAWTVRYDLFNAPALEVSEGAGGGGCGVTDTRLIELTPTGPIVVAEFTTGNHSDSAQWAAKIVPVQRGTAFKVVYKGSLNEAVRFDRSGDKFYSKDKPAPKPTC